MYTHAYMWTDICIYLNVYNTFKMNCAYLDPKFHQSPGCALRNHRGGIIPRNTSPVNLSTLIFSLSGPHKKGRGLMVKTCYPHLVSRKTNFKYIFFKISIIKAVIQKFLTSIIELFNLASNEVRLSHLPWQSSAGRKTDTLITLMAKAQRVRMRDKGHAH